MWMVAALIGGLTAEAGWHGLTIGGQSGSVCIHQMNRVNSRNGYSHDDSTITKHYRGIIRPHRSTTYVGTAYCYIQIAWSVGRSVCLSH